MCMVQVCSETTGKKNAFCRKHWDMLGADLQQSIRSGAEKGSQTLRVAPSKEWLQKASVALGQPLKGMAKQPVGKPVEKQGKAEE